MADNLTSIGLNMIPIEDLQNTLRYVYDFITKEDNATDVNLVAGIAASLIAVAASADDRETIKNALNLGGLPAADYLTKVDGGKITQNYTNIRNIYSGEVRNMKDELYQLKSELARRGFIPNTLNYSGYTDVFRKNDPVHVNTVLATAVDDSINKDEIRIGESVYKDLDNGDYIVLHLKDVGRYHVAKIIAKMPDNETIKFEPSSVFDIKGGITDLYKSIGTVEDGSFAFMEEATMLPGSQEMHSSLNDDTYRTRRDISANNTGFGYTFRIPDSMNGFLSKIRIKAIRYGTPGALVAYVINADDVVKFKNPQQAEQDNLLIAKSKPAYPDLEQVEKLLDFDFFDGDKYPILKNDDTVDKKTRFCLIIEALDGVDINNYYRLMFLQSQDTGGVNGDLQLNNVTYEYKKVDSSSDDLALTTNATINSSDLYYGIVTREIIEKGITPYREGVYTARIKLDEPINASRARLMLRTNREGYFLTGNTTSASYQDGNNLPIKKDPVLGALYDMQEVRGIGAKNNYDKVVIGTNIRKVLNQTPDSVLLEKGIYLNEANTPIYRVGYEIGLKAIRKEYNTNFNIYEEKERVKINLPLSTVMEDRIKKSQKITDRLIFENELVNEDGTAKYFNEFELQVYWRTDYGGFFTDDKYKNDLLGRIHDLILTFDSSL